MFSIRTIAREALPLVVIVWASLAILVSALENAQQGTTPGQDHHAAAAGMGICTVTVALVLRTGLRKIPPRPNTDTKPVWRPGDSHKVCPVAYQRPPLGAPLLQVLQIMRT